MKIASVFPLLLACGLALSAHAEEPMAALIVGGGHDVSSNAAQIEGHTRFVAKLIPDGAKRHVLFADGAAQNDSVTYGNSGEAREALRILLPDASFQFKVPRRKSELGVPIDGQSSKATFRRGFADVTTNLNKDGLTPLLLYFAGHGSTAGPNDKESTYAMWKNDVLTVRDIATQLAKLPEKASVVLVMAQCYSGGFGDVLFREGAKKREIIPQSFAGFFSARRDRTASGCGWETSESSYQDFSSYFFAALSGADQFHHATPGGDYDGDGKVTLHEAFCYALIHDDSFDTPNCTSDAFLRRAVNYLERTTLETSYAEVLAAGTPAQRAVLEALSTRLQLEGDDRALAASDRLNFRDPLARQTQLAASRETEDKLNELRMKTLADYFSRWPALRWEKDADFNKATSAVIAELNMNETLRREVLAAKKAYEIADAALDNEEAYLMRFIDLFTSIVLSKELKERGDATAKAQFARIWQAENNTLPLRANTVIAAD